MQGQVSLLESEPADDVTGFIFDADKTVLSVLGFLTCLVLFEGYVYVYGYGYGYCNGYGYGYGLRG